MSKKDGDLTGGSHASGISAIVVRERRLPDGDHSRDVIFIKDTEALAAYLALERGSQSAGGPDHLVVLVHGINTRAHWMNEVKPVLQKAGFSVAATSYGKFGVPRFLSFRRLREKAVRNVLRDIQTAVNVHKLDTGREPTKMSVISHSFGTYVVSRILVECPHIYWYRIIFCGSVVREDFPLESVLHQFSRPLLNEVGTRDCWPALAESAGWGYGSVGSYGFNRPPVETRWHHGLRHSDFMTAAFCSKYWIPFLSGQPPKPADPAVNLPLPIRAIAWLPLRWLILALLVLVTWGVAEWLARISCGMRPLLPWC